MTFSSVCRRAAVKSFEFGRSYFAAANNQTSSHAKVNLV